MIGIIGVLLLQLNARNVEVGIRCQIQDQISVKRNLFRRLLNFIGISGSKRMRKEAGRCCGGGDPQFRWGIPKSKSSGLASLDHNEAICCSDRPV